MRPGDAKTEARFAVLTTLFRTEPKLAAAEGVTRTGGAQWTREPDEEGRM
jgi:hypothetical protein